MKTGVAIGLAVAAFAAMQGADAAPKKGVLLAPEDIVSARHAAMMMSSSAFGALKAQANAEDLKRANFPAHALAHWAKAIPAMFPQGTDIPPTDALPAVWSDRAGYDAAAKSFVTATDAVTQAVAANDKTAYAAALDQVGKACSACHDKYRKAEEKH
jgi:cytochrome c556